MMLSKLNTVNRLSFARYEAGLIIRLNRPGNATGVPRMEVERERLINGKDGYLTYRLTGVCDGSHCEIVVGLKFNDIENGEDYEVKRRSLCIDYEQITIQGFEE
jgi:hypothetical protein